MIPAFQISASRLEQAPIPAKPELPAEGLFSAMASCEICKTAYPADAT